MPTKHLPQRVSFQLFSSYQKPKVLLIYVVSAFNDVKARRDMVDSNLIRIIGRRPVKAFIGQNLPRCADHPEPTSLFVTVVDKQFLSIQRIRINERSLHFLLIQYFTIISLQKVGYTVA